MNRSKYTTPRNAAAPSSSRPTTRATTGTKRDSLQAELERDPQLSTAKRQQRTEALSTSMARASLERQLVAAQTAKLELETKLREKESRIDALESDRLYLSEEGKKCKEELERETGNWETQKAKVDSELRELRAALTSLREEHADLQDAHSSLSNSTSNTIASQKSQIITLTSHLSHLQSQVSELQALASERGNTISSLQNEIDELSSAQADTSRASMEEQNWDVLRQELHRQTGYTSKLESANVKLKREIALLKDRQTSVEVLREEKRGLEKKVQGVDKLRERVITLEGELQAAQKERKEWATRATQLDNPSKVPVTVTQSLSALRLEHARLLEEHGAAKALLRTREAEVAALQDRESENRETIETLQQDQRRLKDKLSRLEHGATLAEREVGFLKSLNESYIAEESANQTGEVDRAKDEQIKNLTELIEEYRAKLDAAEKALEQRPETMKPTTRSEELKAQLEALKQTTQELEDELKDRDVTIEEHETQIESLEQTLFELRGEIGAGHHVPPGVRVLSMKENPMQEWFDSRKEVFDRLKSENEALMNRLRELEEAGIQTQTDGEGSSPNDLVPRESWEVVNKEKVELQAELKAKDKRILRLQQVFSVKAEEFKSAVSSIMGLKVAFYPNGQVRVTSQYDLNVSFIFQPSKAPAKNPVKASMNANKDDEEMSMTLVAQGEGGPQDLPQIMRNWIEVEHSIPGFMASVTLECYDKWKSEHGQGQA